MFLLFLYTLGLCFLKCNAKNLIIASIELILIKDCMKKNRKRIIVWTIISIVFGLSKISYAMDKNNSIENSIINSSILDFDQSVQDWKCAYYVQGQMPEKSRIENLWNESVFKESEENSINLEENSLMSLEDYLSYMITQHEQNCIDMQDQNNFDEYTVHHDISRGVIQDTLASKSVVVHAAEKKSVKYKKKKKKSAAQKIIDTNEDSDDEYLDQLIADNRKDTENKKQSHFFTVKQVDGKDRYTLKIQDLGAVIDHCFLDMAAAIKSHIDGTRPASEVQLWDKSGYPFVLEAVADYLEYNKKHELEVKNYYITVQMRDGLEVYLDAVNELPESPRKKKQLSFIAQMQQMFIDAKPIHIEQIIASDIQHLGPFIEHILPLLVKNIDEQVKNLHNQDGLYSQLWKDSGEPYIFVPLQCYIRKGGNISDFMRENIEAYRLKIVKIKVHYASDKNSKEYQNAQRFYNFAAEMKNFMSAK